MKIKLQTLIISVLIPLAAGFVGSLFTTPSIPTWYATLNKPSFNPPSYLFAPVWTFLFILIGLAFYLVVTTKTKKSKKFAYKVYFTQITLNTLWSILFFGLQNPALALIEILILWSTILANIYYFYKIKKDAALLLIPYLLWVTFATLLNFSIWQLN